MTLRIRPAIAMAILVVSVAAVVATVGAGAGATPSAVVWHAASELQGASGPGAVGPPYLPLISCGAPGNCGAAGSLASGSAFVASEVDSTWHRAMSIPGVNAMGGAATVDSLDCLAANNCIVGGGVTVATNDQHAFVDSEVDGRWQSAQPLPGIANLSHYNDAEVQSVSCISPGNCSAAGSYVGSAAGCQSFLGCPQVFVASEVSGHWHSAIAVPEVANVTDGYSTYGFLSCTSAGACDGVGVDGSQNFAFGEREVDGTWGAGTKLSLAALPGYQAGNEVSFRSLSCWSSGNCTASGDYMNGVPQPGGFAFDPFIVDEVDGSWGEATAQGAGDAMSCPSSGACTAIGGDVVVEEVGGVWQQPETIQGVEGAPAGPPDSISCASPGYCSAVIAAGNSYVANEVDGTWQSAEPLELGPTVTGPQKRDILTSVSCSSDSSCSAIGIAINNSDTEQMIDSVFGPDAPLLRRVTPNVGPSRGDVRVVLYGSNFAPSPIVLFGSRPATKLTLVNDGAIKATIPAGTGVVSVRVITPWGTSSGIRFAYRG